MVDGMKLYGVSAGRPIAIRVASLGACRRGVFRLSTINYRPSTGLPGFTLLEMMIVLFIISLLSGVAVVSFNSVSREQEVRRPALEFQKLVREAVRRAAATEEPQIIVFDKKGFAMRFRNDTGDNLAWQHRVDIPVEMTLSLRRFGADKFAAAAGQRLVIAPGGLCEPLSARFELHDSWVEFALDPLSGGARDESMVIQ